ncbi:protein kinase [Microbispora sp. NPDC049125]|uniref:serine/threonine-protein kinase n=1 Tax=Microbispora sp. NPDC049125 TaxID=3154929 RepID=UPI003464FCB0
MGEAGGPLVPGYETLGILGQGGFGVVYRARQLAVGREVALKVDNRVLVSDRDRRRFMREVTSAGALSGHPHVADVYDAGVLPDGRPYMVLELCPNGSLADRLRERGPMSPRDVRDAGMKIADALAAAHGLGVLHRDVKPANILINSYGMVALSDFGLATMPGQGGARDEVSVTRESLTPAYAPPEAFDLTEPTAAGDVYSLAATLYALLSGRPPRFPESGVVNIAVIMALHRLPVPDIPGVPPALTAVLRHGMVSDPARRLPTAAGLRDALAALEPDGSGAPAAAVPGQRPPSSPPSGAYGPHVPHSPAYDVAARVPEQRHPSGPGSHGTIPPPPHLGTGRGAVRDPRDLRRAATSPPGAGAVRDPRDARRAATSPGGAATRPPADLPGGGSRHSLVFGAVTAAFALLLAGGLAVMLLEGRAPGAQPSARPTAHPTVQETSGTGERTATPAAVDVGVPATTRGCPAAQVRGAGAACVTTAECWAGLVSVAGDVTARPVACGRTHAWETFAIARLPADLTSSDEDTVARNPTVAGLCSMATLLRSRRGQAASVAAGRWSAEVLPPSAARFAAGDRTYRCVGRVTGEDRAGSSFHG